MTDEQAEKLLAELKRNSQLLALVNRQLREANLIARNAHGFSKTE